MTISRWFWISNYLSSTGPNYIQLASSALHISSNFVPIVKPEGPSLSEGRPVEPYPETVYCGSHLHSFLLWGPTKSTPSTAWSTRGPISRRFPLKFCVYLFVFSCSHSPDIYFVSGVGVSRGSSVTLVSDYRLNDRSSITGRGKGYFL
jgi:hypothetical protein